MHCLPRHFCQLKGSFRKIFFESFEYVPDAKIRCLLVTAPLISPSDYDQYAMEEMKVCLEKPANCECLYWRPVDKLKASSVKVLHDSPIAILRGVYVHLRRKDFIQRNKEAIVPLISPLVTSTVSHRHVNSMTEDSVATNKEWAIRAGEELSLALFSNEELCKERLKLNIAMICDVSMEVWNDCHPLLHSSPSRIDRFPRRIV
jgi:hypothetical protein